jgi:hypothetical protein
MIRYTLLCWLVLAAADPLADEADLRRPSAITTIRVPLVPTDLFLRLAQYQNVREGSLQEWAADGSCMLIRTRFGDAAQFHRVYEPARNREQVTFFEELASGRPFRVRKAICWPHSATAASMSRPSAPSS